MPDLINGLYGTIYDEDGAQVQMTQEFESGVEFEKKEFTVPGKFLKSHQVLSGTASGNFNVLKLDTRLQRKIAENPTAKYSYVGKLKKPTSKGEEAVLYMGVSFDGTQLLSYNVEDAVEADFDFTFDDFRYLSEMI